ncbi:hypothetical protein ACJRPK_13895 [Aquimarina sp. 2-A2]|uniref:hypothetical protein n=1 Tax=Aquimarina sp. 2-A2 TaxID=3382644 RepID=UPI00387F284A
MKDTENSDLLKLLNNGLNVVDFGYNGNSFMQNLPFYKVEGNKYTYCLSQCDFQTGKNLQEDDLWKVYYRGGGLFFEVVISNEIIESENNASMYIENAIEYSLIRNKDK